MTALRSQKRYGKLQIPDEVYLSEEYLHLVMPKTIPVRVEHMKDAGFFDIIAISPLFQELGEGDDIPEYIFVISEDGSDVRAEMVQ